MKTKYLITLIAVAQLALATSHATLIGDQVRLSHYLPDTNSPFVLFGSQDVIVSSDDSDLREFGSFYTINMNAFGFEVVFTGKSKWSSNPFNGLGVTDMDWSGLGLGGILGFSIHTNLVGWIDSRFSFDEHSAFSNWSGLEFNTDSFFNVVFDVDQPNVDPDPIPSVSDSSSTAALLGLGILGLTTARSRIRAHR